MKRNLIYINILFGVLTWIVPFAVSLLFFDEHGTLTISFDLFKAVTLLAAIFNGCIFVYFYFRLISKDYLKHGIVLGNTWMVINFILDILVLPAMMQNSFVDYFNSFGLLYAIFPAMTIAVGWLLQLKFGGLHPHPKYWEPA